MGIWLLYCQHLGKAAGMSMGSTQPLLSDFLVLLFSRMKLQGKKKAITSSRLQSQTFSSLVRTRCLPYQMPKINTGKYE